MWIIEISPKYHFVSVVNYESDEPRINLGAISVGIKDGLIKETAHNHKIMEFAKKIANALNKQETSNN